MRPTVFPFPGAVILLAAVLAAAACSASSPPASATPRASLPTGRAATGPAVAAAERRVHCGPQQRQASVPLPAGFVADAAVLCPLAVRPLRGQGHGGYPKQEAGHGLAALVAALRRRPAPPASDMVCATQAVAVPVLFLIGPDGQVIRPVIPHDACGRPLPQVLDVLQHLRWVTVPDAG